MKELGAVVTGWDGQEYGWRGVFEEPGELCRVGVVRTGLDGGGVSPTPRRDRTNLSPASRTGGRCAGVRRGRVDGGRREGSKGVLPGRRTEGQNTSPSSERREEGEVEVPGRWTTVRVGVRGGDL